MMYLYCERCGRLDCFAGMPVSLSWMQMVRMLPIVEDWVHTYFLGITSFFLPLSPAIFDGSNRNRAEPVKFFQPPSSALFSRKMIP